MCETFFLHGLDSSSKGTKGQWFTKHFPDVRIPDFQGDLQTRLNALETLCCGRNNLILVGSSFGGLMATCFAIRHPNRCHALVLLAPALNFPEFSPPQEKIVVPAILIIGSQDTVTPPARVLPLAQKCFSQLQIFTCDDDHMLHNSFEQLDWQHLLQKDSP
ncbi:MAG: alpha/beta fold hydrolase [Proteobacteria bacterium]|nr:alpha/beta fold hydrolase [Pseudomonadota bacterium]MBU1417840.1 alpha/beta fold hydrolase [Pseudomonadota bacterium]MBU1453657.1 alpha/beta fold hydrolase [Pseudomonadota bacterium]